MAIDSSRFPRMAQYLSTLPNGALSYPECRVRSDSRERLLAAVEQLSDDPALPLELRRMIVSGGDKRWCSEVQSSALLLVVRDVVLTTDEAFLAWSHEGFYSVYAGAIYRALMALISPSLIVIGAASRWKTFHEGSQFSAQREAAKNGQIGASATLTYPDRLFQGILLDFQMEALKTALEIVKVSGLEISYQEVSATKTVFNATWTE